MVSELASLVQAKVTDAYVEVVLSDGRRLATPLAWYPTLESASRDELDNLEVWPWGLHWPQLDEDLSLDGMLSGQPGSRPRAMVPVESRRPDQPAVHAVDANEAGLHNGLIDFPNLKSPVDG